MSTFWNDLRHGARIFGRRPGFVVVVVLTLALGIGANTAIFSVVNALLLQPLSLPDSDRLVAVAGRTKEGRRTFVSYPDYQDLRRATGLFEGFTAFVPQSVNLTGREEPTRVRGGFVSDSFFDLIGVRPAVGRGFRKGDDDLGAPGVCVLNHEAWQGVFGGDPGLLGSTLTLNNAPFTVVGIMPAGFRFPYDEIEVWIPHHHWPVFLPSYQRRADGLVAPIGRLKAGVSFAQGRTQLETIAARLAKEYPEAGQGRSFTMRRLQEAVVSDVGTALLVLLGAVTLVLLIASANVGGLLLAHTASRVRELATRAALGANRVRLARQLLSETVLLWLAGGAAGLLTAQWVQSALLSLAPDALPGGIEPRLDAWVLAYALGVTVLTSVLFGILPAWRFSRPNLAEALKEGGHAAGAGGSRTSLRGALVVAQLALTLVLLAGSGSMIRSLERLTQVQLGYRPQNLLTLEYRLPANKYPAGPQQWKFHSQVVERVRQLPGVRAASVVRALPFSGNGGTAGFELPDRPADPGAPAQLAEINTADAYYFQTMGLPLLRGRVFDERDHEKAPLAVVINDHMAERFWPGQDAVGRTVRFPDEPPRTATIIGVVADVKHNGLDDEPVPQIYAAQAQNFHIFATLVVRTEGDPLAMAAAVRGAVWSLDKDQPVWKVRTLESLIERSLGLRLFLTRLLSAYAGLALALAAVGLYGVVAYSVASRTREIGVRVALGADRAVVLRLVLARALWLAGAGVAIGLAGSAVADRALRSLLFEARASDPALLATVAFLLVLVALAAAWAPARRATRVDPLVALRSA